ncbi:TPA: DEAD/DEAH box helicase [Legionella pneumophila]|nr:type ISP restriction/modification enzyme [Legionella pneumophila]HCC3243471.1 DEAD/DEAH box helicase [Legionella pneumophila subsp. pneumophila]MCZ4759856.1 DEAD/DEAH box helicase family protein [Legionella pneumophila]MDI9828825.1 DEAD/DEAH box helicase family protein [Legionella pneumophila]MDW8853522.1 type ISP restriction/modification enzyme [Legionella pneumophila]MDW8920756.1 type ISP restriction/modification enzyme [Legionella pneumophila]
MAKYLMTDPQYADRLSNVWLWSDWPDHEGVDVGVDLVACEKNTGDYWAIQCKFFDPNHSIQKSDIDSFFTASGKNFQTSDGKRHNFSQRVIISTTDKWSKNAENALENQSIPVCRIWFKDLENSPIDWEHFELSKIQDIRLRPRKTLQDHQDEALSNATNGLKEFDRGKLIMACGTGKTFTSLRLMERLVPIDGRVLFLAPSISLISQSLREWTAESIKPIHAFVVCSDTKVGKEEEDIPLHDLAYPATTNATKLVHAANVLTKDRPTVIFSTYQSIQVIAEAQKLNLGEFDLIICDEAHRTTGLTLPNEDPSEFVKVHNNDIIRGKKRIYMTATPRIYCGTSKSRANEASATLFSMDDETVYGKELYRLGFGKAVERNLLTDYKVLIVAVKESEMAKLTNDYNAYKLDEKKAIDVNFVTKIIGSWKGISKDDLIIVDDKEQTHKLSEDTSPMRRAIAFSKSIKDSKLKAEIFSILLENYRQQSSTSKMIPCSVRHIDGSMNSQIRKRALDWLKEESDECRILSNARCLSEGIDVPALDAVVFFDTRESIVDIVQSVGRVMRKADGKKYGYIILPVCIPSERVTDYNDYIERDPQFKGIWKVIKALRAHDESLVDEAQFRRKIRVIADNSRQQDNEDYDSQLPLNFPNLPLEAINEAVYAAIPQKLGDREYWSEWAKDIGQTAGRLIARIKDLINTNPELSQGFSIFHKGLQDTLNPAITQEDTIEMLAQHILTLPVFKALFESEAFPENNVVAKALESIVNKLETASLSSETESLEKFYKNVKERISYAKSDKSKQEIIRNLYDTFFQNAFPRMSEKLGIVYTPTPVVDFILNSVQVALNKHFHCKLGDNNVHILEPFCGTGTFLVRLIESGLIDNKSLPYKYTNELHANEIVLLAYYIATVNIETAFHGVTKQYKPFNGIVLVDTFQMTEKDDIVDKVVLPENNGRAELQLKQPIKIIIGNPPYSAQQSSENDNNKNNNYPDLDDRIATTYAAKSKAKLLKNLYDSYIRAIRWASDRISDNGIIAFITNGSFVDANNMDGLRKSLTDEFSHLYIFNLRGNARTQGEQRCKEGGGIFGEGSRTPVAITVMVKDTSHSGACELYYHDIGDYLSRQEKFDIINKVKNIENIEWQKITPNQNGDWINQRAQIFEQFVMLGNKNEVGAYSVFNTYSQGILSARDFWVYNSNKNTVESNIRRMIHNYNSNRLKYFNIISDNSKQQINIEAVINSDPKQISWSRALKNDAKQNKELYFESASIVQSIYRPFFKQWMYFNRRLNEMVYQMPKLFPTSKHHNFIIMTTGIGASKEFSCLVSNVVPNYHMHDTGQCFPLYWYEKIEDNSNYKNSCDHFDGYIRHDAISDWALQTFHNHYQDNRISKEDIFWYIYGILHSPEYKKRFSSSLKKMLARIPFAKDFHIFCDAGRRLGKLHLNYENIEPYPLIEEKKKELKSTDYFVNRMIFGKKDGKPDKSIIIFNEFLIFKDIPLEVYDYVVNGKSAIEWIMDRYKVTVDKESGIKNDPNSWSDDPYYIVNLLKRIVRLSIESIEIIKNLPALQETTKQYN